MPVYFKFEDFDEFNKLLNSYEGTFVTIFKPNKNSGETHSYTEIEIENLEEFLIHFEITDAIILDNGNVAEWPESLESNSNRRSLRFTAIDRL